MARGSVYRHSEFQFHDGQIGEKRFVVLNEPVGNDPYLVIKTTSRLGKQPLNKGCNPSRGVFFIPQNSEPAFPLDTVLQLLDIYEFSKEQFLSGSLRDRTITFIDDLSPLSVAQIVNCVRKLKQDISEKHFTMITRQ